MLMAWKAAEERKEAKRTEKVNAELQTVTSPQISKKAQALSSSIPVYERLIQKYASAQEALEKERKNKEEAQKAEEAQFVGYKPKLTRQSERLDGRGHEATLAWEQDKKRHLAELAEEAERELAEEARFRPEINPRSAKIAQKTRRDGERIEDHLLEFEARRRLHLLEKASEIDAVEAPGHPQITPVAAALRREGNAFDRLYEMATVLEEKKKLAQDIKEKERTLMRPSSTSGTPSSHHHEEDRERERERVRVEDDILRRSQESKRKLQARWEAELAALIAPAKMNPASAEMAARLPTSAWERLQSPRAAPAPREPEHVSRELAECTFKPQINPKSRKLAESGGAEDGHADRGEYLFSKSMQRIKKLEAMREERDRQALAECTFKPKTISAPQHNMGNGYAVEQGQQDVVDRLENWAKRRDDKIAKEREIKDSKETEDCTFTPQVDSNSVAIVDGSFSPRSTGSGSGSVAASKSLNEDDVPGLEDFLRRQEKARILREQSKHVPHASGENWTPDSTIPEEPKFSQRRDRNKIRALRQPASPLVLREILVANGATVLNPHTASSGAGSSFGSANSSSGAASSGTGVGGSAPGAYGSGGMAAASPSSSGALLREGAFSSMLFSGYASQRPSSSASGSPTLIRTSNQPAGQQQRKTQQPQQQKQRQDMEDDGAMDVDELRSPEAQGSRPPLYSPAA
jgi:hypothetical protein